MNVRRSITSKFPRLYKLLLPLWVYYLHKLWKLRNIFSNLRPVEVKTAAGSIFMLPEGHIAETIWKHPFEQDERHFVEKYLKPGMCVLNVGGNSGLYSLIAAKIIGPRGCVHAFEPTTLNFDRLNRNVKLNGFENVIINQMAVSDFNGSLAVLPDPAHPKLDSHYFVQRVIDGKPTEGFIELITCTTLDNYWMMICKKNGPTKVDMIILDVEGSEHDVFKGANAIFELSPNLIIMAECTSKLDEIEVLLRKKGFKFFKWNNAKMLEEIQMQRGNIFAFR